MEAVILIGIQATGKSTFYKERFFDTHLRVNLDMLKTRRREGILLEACIRAQMSFVVDNTNVLASERAKYISLAKPAGYEITGYYFNIRLKDALERNKLRLGKALIAEKGIRAKFHRLEHPRYDEGFDHLYSVTINPRGGFLIEEWNEPDPNPIHHD